MLIVMCRCFFPLALKQVNAVVVVTILMTHMQKLCVPDVIKNLNVKVFNLKSKTNEKRHIEWHETCKCKCRLHGSVYNNKQRWNVNKCRSECKELIDKDVRDKEFIRNPSNCECKCDKSCDVGEYLDYESCKCRKKLVDKLLEECTKTVEVKLAKIALAEDKNKHKCSPFTLYIVLFSILFKINVGIGTYFVYFYWYLKKRCSKC